MTAPAGTAKRISIARLVPARRAMRVDRIVALRYEPHKDSRTAPRATCFVRPKAAECVGRAAEFGGRVAAACAMAFSF
jgi:hypothetical protein